MKITLFFCAGNLAETIGVHRVSEMNGVGRRMPWTMAAFTVGALGMIGVPPIAGFVSKWYLGTGSVAAGADWVIVVLGASSLLNAMYFFRSCIGPGSANPTASGPATRPPRTGNALDAADAAGVDGIAGIAGRAAGGCAFQSSGVGNTDRGRRIPAVNPIQSATGWQAETLLVAALVAPVALALLGAIRSFRRHAPWMAVLAALRPCYARSRPRSGQRWIPWLMLKSRFAMDATGKFFLLFTSILWLLSALSPQATWPGMKSAFGFSLDFCWPWAATSA